MKDFQNFVTEEKNLNPGMNQYWQKILDILVYPISHPQIKTDLALPLSNEKKFEFSNYVLAEDVKLVLRETIFVSSKQVKNFGISRSFGIISLSLHKL